MAVDGGEVGRVQVWRGGGGISERGLRMVQPKNRENGEEEGAAGGERERVGP